MFMEFVRSILFFLILSTIAGQLVDGTKYKPYVSLALGFMLLLLMIRPIMSWIGDEDMLQDVFSQISENTESFSFEQDAAKAKEKQVKKGMETVLEEYGIDVSEVEVSLQDDGEIESVEIEAADGKKAEKKIKTLLSRFYNVKDSNINISE